MCFCNPSIRTPYCKSFECQEELKRINGVPKGCKHSVVKRIECYNSEPDGRLIIKQGENKIVISPDYIDTFAELIKVKCGSESDCDGFDC